MTCLPYVTILCLIFSLYAIEAKKAKCEMDGRKGVGKVKGTIMMYEKDNNVTIKYDLEGIKPENTNHGFHIHESGKLGNACKDARGHFNPEKKLHGGKNDAERHLGDLGNIKAISGKAEGTIVDNKISLSGANTVIGKAFVIHEGVDDLGKGNDVTSNTTGNAGSRLQCCVIVESAAIIPAISALIIPFIILASYLTGV